MIPVVLQQLERLQRELAAIDPDHDIEAAAQVAAIATALRAAGAPEGDHAMPANVDAPDVPVRRVA